MDNAPVNLMLLDDDPADRLVAARALRRAFPQLIIHEAVGVEDTRALVRIGCAFAVIDYDLEGSAAAQVIQALRSRESVGTRVMVVAYSASKGEDLHLSDQSGADKFLLKSANPVEFANSLIAAIRLFLDR